MMTTPAPVLVRRLALAVVAVLLLAACGGDGSADEAATEPADGATEAAATDDDVAEATEPMATEDETEDTEAAAGTTVATADSDLGEIIVDADGRTLYLLTADSPGESTCFDECAEAWPPFTTDADPTAGKGADAALLGSIDRDGAMQVTYGDWPLYYFQGDAGPGDVNGQGIESFGGLWWVVGPDGEAVEDTDTAAAAGGGAGGY